MAHVGVAGAPRDLQDQGAQIARIEVPDRPALRAHALLRRSSPLRNALECVSLLGWKGAHELREHR